MSDKFVQAAQSLSDSEKNAALESFLENATEPAAGVARQILGEEKKPLTEKQQHVHDKYIEPHLVEKCSAPGCSRFSSAGETYCATCEVEYGGK